MEVWDNTPVETDPVLQRKLDAVHAICDMHRISDERREIILGKVRAGHEEYGDRPEDIDCIGELVGERADDIGYMAQILATVDQGPVAGEWTVRHALYVRMALDLWDLLDEIVAMQGE